MAVTISMHFLMREFLGTKNLCLVTSMFLRFSEFTGQISVAQAPAKKLKKSSSQ